MSSSPAKTLNWESPAGRLLARLAEGLPKDRPITLHVFGSSPLQIKLDAGFTSGDVDLFSDEDIGPLVRDLKLGKGQSDPFVEVNTESTFIAAPSWMSRADKKSFGNITVYLAAPIDVLVGKVKRLEPKDLLAFDLVREHTGGPTEDELRHALGRVVDMYRPAFDEENPGGDPISNTRRLWQHLYGRDIDVRKEIIEPSLASRKESYGETAPKARQALSELTGPVPHTKPLPPAPSGHPSDTGHGGGGK